MSGIYIKGMEMPKNCKECYDNGICYHIHHIANCPLCGENENPASYVLTGAKHHDCPLFHVQPHGRLIDADALVSDLMYDVELDAVALDDMTIVGAERQQIQDDKDFKQNCAYLIENAVTIIPASE